MIKRTTAKTGEAVIKETHFEDGKVLKEVIDNTTGEVILRGWQIYRQAPSGGKPPNKPKQPPFVKVWMPNLLDLIKRKHLTQGEKSLLFDLLVFLDWQSTMLVHPEKGYAVNTSDIASYLGLSIGYVSQTLNSLNKKGIIGKFNAGEGRPNRYHLNCNIAFYGNKMNDYRDYERFNRDCAYMPVVVVEYEKETNTAHMIRRDIFNT